MTLVRRALAVAILLTVAMSAHLVTFYPAYCGGVAVAIGTEAHHSGWDCGLYFNQGD